MVRHYVPMSTGDEYDLFGWGRRYYRWKRGQRRWIKRNYLKRERRYLKRSMGDGW